MRKTAPAILAALAWATSLYVYAAAGVSGHDAKRAVENSAALDYLEQVSGKQQPYLPPSALDPRFTVALYVNAKGKGPNAQRMWVLQRSEIGGPWQLALWDKTYWQQKGLEEGEIPPYSWLVSTGRKYRGDKRSGRTPVGIYAIDERPNRVKRGYASPGMYDAFYLDLHYSGGRRSGVAFHGTTRRQYKKLGRIASHGCIRMTQGNALMLLDRLVGTDDVLSQEMRWGSVPRFWRSERGNVRVGYHRDGSTHPAPATPEVLTKEGYRAIAVIFKD